ncbi:hypothetical protein Poli38472_002577 [Pythium oligandrum]|uniref:Uncharacterized protein n=1 Tax=Pythium oligandrum TaxID=41045 RepID=A0A8K1CHG5_PYTOL|nr:hypothetical protein Poli38472_002577 [Pythium oligandrum]|eukprot:TMW63636.1 hypothetical protein Poli38472_002577 [Pythium oligandrum]
MGCYYSTTYVFTLVILFSFVDSSDPIHQNPLLDLPKLLFQTDTLFTYLHDGFPLAIISIYSSLLFINWMISSYRYKRWRPDPHLLLARLFYSFDLFFAVFSPLEVLVYARYRFVFDRDEYQTRVEALVPGVFDHVAKLYADPVQVSRFRIGFHYLQFSSVSSLFIKSALNVLSLYKWMRTFGEERSQRRLRQYCSVQR